MSSIELKLTQKRRKRLLEQAVAKDGQVSQEDDTFTDDCEQLVRKIALMREILEPLAYPLPQVRVTGIGRHRTLHVKARPFAKQLQERNVNDRKELARRLLEYELKNGEKLVPHKGASIFLGYGTTLFFLALEMLEPGAEFECNILTCNFEAAAAFYFGMPERFAHGQLRLRLPGCDVDWNSGGLRLNREMEIDTSIVSVDTVSPNGKFSTKNPDTSELTEQAVARAKRQVIVVADHQKIDGVYGGGSEITIKKAGRSLFFVTDRPVSEACREVLESNGFNLIVAVESASDKKNPPKPR